MNRPTYDLIEEEIGKVLSKYLWEHDTEYTRSYMMDDVNDMLNKTYNTNEVYVTNITEDSDGKLIIDINPNGVIQTREQRINEIIGSTEYIDIKFKIEHE